jgi:hypothetical protein
VCSLAHPPLCLCPCPCLCLCLCLCLCPCLCPCPCLPCLPCCLVPRDHLPAWRRLPWHKAAGRVRSHSRRHIRHIIHPLRAAPHTLRLYAPEPLYLHQINRPKPFAIQEPRHVWCARDHRQSLLRAYLIGRVVDPHRLPLTEDPDRVPAVRTLGQGLRSTLERRHNNANASGACGVVPRGGSDDSAGLVLLLVLQESTVDCLCPVCSCWVCGDDRCHSVGCRACACGRLSCDVLSKAVKPRGAEVVRCLKRLCGVSRRVLV